MKRPIIITFILLVGIFNACVHDPSFVEVDPDPTDTTKTDTMPSDTMTTDTTGNTAGCDTSIVYFNTDILPIFMGNCAISGCHDVITKEHGVAFVNYEMITSSDHIVPFNLDKSEVYEKITEDDAKEVMPPTGRMSADKINLIRRWILQGAPNNFCEPNAGGCDTTKVTFGGFVSKALTTSCNGCHNSVTKSGGISLDNYAGVKKIVDAKRLYGAIARLSGFVPMPQGQNKLDDCTIKKIKTWIDEGAQNN